MAKSIGNVEARFSTSVRKNSGPVAAARRWVTCQKRSSARSARTLSRVDFRAGARRLVGFAEEARLGIMSLLGNALGSPHSCSDHKEGMEWKLSNWAREDA